MRGAKPKPTALKLIRGNPGCRPINKNEPKPSVGCEKPKFLVPRAAEIWDQYAPKLTRLGLLTELDGPLFALFCTLCYEMENSEEYHFTAQRMSQLRGVAASFGMEPSSRARLGVKDDGDKTEDPAAKYFKLR